MNRSFRSLAAASAALLLAATAASAQQPPPPGYAPPPPGYAPPPPGYAPPAQPAPQLQSTPSGPGIQLEAFTGYQMNGDVDGIYGKIAIDDAQSFGVTLWKQVRPGTKLQLKWIYSSFDAQFQSYSYVYQSTQKFNVMQNYFQLGGVQSMRRGKIEPFAGGTLGAVWWSPDNVKTSNGLVTYNASDSWRFAITLGLGLNVFLTEKLAIRGHADMLMPMIFNGGSVYVGTGGSGMAVSAGVPAISGDFGVGLVFSP